MNAIKMTDNEFGKFRDFIQAELGIKMPPAKKTLLESRLQKRLRLLGLKSFGYYCDYLFSPGGIDNELVHMIDLVTTNKTDFFRESHHFEVLYQSVLPELVRHGAGTREQLRVWSAGCSTGEEPYTIAIVLNEFAQAHPEPGLDYSILGTDISTRVLECASRGIYGEDRVAPIPLSLRRKYLLRNKDKERPLVKISPELMSKVEFKRLNFMDEVFRQPEAMDIVFCRNVIIYFDKYTQEKLFRKFAGCMKPGSFLFIGHSETLAGFDLPFIKMGQALYRKI
ncbi:MAG: protein-glutamate O-methyltransferase [Deltaproteobacteria bacterium]|nr:protein-glutamate O-methyltransferase [Deltaproteobacteria bacterium]